MDWFDRVPKTELHLHLEGAIPYEALWTLIGKYGGDPTVPDLDALKRRFVFKDFPHFIQTWIWKNQYIREYEDFTFFSEAVAHDLAAQRILYAEVFFTPSEYADRGLDVQRITEAVRAGLARVPETEVALIADLCRDFGPERGARTLASISEVRGCGVIGIGIGGSEQRFPPEPFEAVYAEARRRGFHVTAHAGEAAGAESVWGAIRTLKVERIGHGTRAGEDERLLDHLAQNRIPVEMCPLSNVRTGVVPSLEAHPVRKFFERGLTITINSDDPKMFGNSLAEEYRLLESVHGFSREEIRGLILQGIRASWLSEDRKRRLVELYEADPGWRGGDG